MQTYNPVNCSPEKFHAKFIENYEKWKEHGFFEVNKIDPRKYPSADIRVTYSGGTRRGALQKALANVYVNPYSQRLIYSKRKTEDLGSVIIAAMSSGDLRLALTDLQNLTGIKLKKVS